MDTKAPTTLSWQPPDQRTRDEIVMCLIRSLMPTLADLAARDPWGVLDVLMQRTPALDGRRPIDVLLRDPAQMTRIDVLVRTAYL